ncbi:response regulator [Ideonella sp. DXS29W]|uniref:Response regulator n=1 Tax=Ideonella lacteola TaxID=2984193 RepID=A0ABU9BIC1_9BURK
MSSRPTLSPTTSVPATAARQVLVVDDNRDAAQSLAMLLELMGHDTAMAHDGQDALRCAENFNPQVVLLDIGMPRMDGIEACRRLRARVTGASMSIVALTGLDQGAVQIGPGHFDAQLVKPVGWDELIQLLHALPPPTAMS